MQSAASLLYFTLNGHPPIQAASHITLTGHFTMLYR